jgi:hypothetical protein
MRTQVRQANGQIARGIVGYGVGGDYPSTALLVTEAANEQFLSQRGTLFIMLNQFTITMGGPFALTVFLIAYSAAGLKHLDTVWRVSFGCGVVLPLTVFWFRLRMMNSKMYKRSALRTKVPYKLMLKYYWPRLIGTCGTWFIYDFVTFPLIAFSGAIIDNVISPQNVVKSTAEWLMLLDVLGIPGIFIGIGLTKTRLGFKYTQMLGYLGYVVFGLAIGLSYEKLSKHTAAFIIMFGLIACVGNIGPGNLTGLIGSHSYATAVRGTCYGISAAWGKTGAVIGTQVFKPVENNLGIRWVFIIAAILGLLGIILTYFFIPNLSKEDLVLEDQKFTQYLLDNGWTGDMGEGEMRAHITQIEDFERK